MEFDRKRIQGFGNSDAPATSENKFWDAVGELKAQLSQPVQTAIDSVTLCVNDVIEEVSQDFQDMADDIKQMVTGEDGSAVRQQPVPEKTRLTPQERSDGLRVVSSFCDDYHPTRVAPKEEELETLWDRCSMMPREALSGALTEHLSWTTGELEWQPRLRVLYALEFLMLKGGVGQEITLEVFLHASNLLSHLATEVPQCKEMGERVINLVAAAQEQVAASGASPAPSSEPPMVKDLLGSPVCSPAHPLPRRPPLVQTPVQDAQSPISDIGSGSPPPVRKVNPPRGKAGGTVRRAATVDLLDMSSPLAPPTVAATTLVEPITKGHAGSLLDVASVVPDTEFDPNAPSGAHRPNGISLIGSGASAPSPLVCGAQHFGPTTLSHVFASGGQRSSLPASSSLPWHQVPPRPCSSVGQLNMNWKQEYEYLDRMAMRGSMSFGKDMWEVPAVDPFSFVSDHIGLKPN